MSKAGEYYRSDDWLFSREAASMSVAHPSVIPRLTMGVYQNFEEIQAANKEAYRRCIGAYDLYYANQKDIKDEVARAHGVEPGPYALYRAVVKGRRELREAQEKRHLDGGSHG